MHPLPDWTFPDSNPRKICIGVVSGIGLVRDSPAAANIAKPFIGPFKLTLDYTYMTRLTKIKSKVDFTLPITALRDKESLVERQLDYFAGTHPDSWLPKDLLRGLVYDQLTMERNNRRFDTFAGNRLAHFSDLLAFPSGKNQSHLGYVHTLKSQAARVVLNTPIQQITPCKSRLNSTGIIYINQDLLLVRSMEGVHAIQLQNDSSELKMHVIKDLKFDSEPAHVASNHAIPGQAAILLKRGQVLIWDAKGANYITWSNSESNETQSWQACEFGSHPRTIFLSQYRQIDFADLRAPSTSHRTCIFKTKNTEFINSFKRNPKKPFHVAVATNTRMLLLDSRYTRAPMLDWDLNSSYETQTIIEFMPDIKAEFYSWGRLGGEIMLYSYKSNHGIPPISFKPQKLKSFINHSSFKSVLSNQVSCTSLSDKTQQLQLQDERSLPCGPNLVGSQCIKTTHGISLMHLADDGSLFVQGYSPLEPLGDAKSLIVSELKDIESRVIEVEVELLLKSPTQNQNRNYKLTNLAIAAETLSQPSAYIQDQVQGPVFDGEIIQSFTPLRKMPISISHVATDMLGRWTLAKDERNTQPSFFAPVRNIPHVEVSRTQSMSQGKIREVTNSPTKKYPLSQPLPGFVKHQPKKRKSGF